jgi:UDP-N-acetylglucosamine:LPS N-acetylglucosamine transferase
MLEEAELSGTSLVEALRPLIGCPTTLAEMEAAARRLGRPDAAAKVADLLLGPGATQGTEGARV